MNGDTTNLPRPDPSTLTTEQLHREIELSKLVLDALLDGQTSVSKEKFATVEQQFALVERQRVEQKLDTKQAVDAALTAQKEAVREQTTASERAIAKSEASTTANLKQLGDNFSTTIDSLRRMLDDLKDRIVSMESVRQGGRDAHYDLYLMVAVVGVIVSIYFATH